MDTNTIRQITIKGSTDGVDEATASLQKLSDATDQVITVSTKSSQSTLSVQAAVDRYQKSLDSTYRNQTSFQKAQDTLNKGLDQGVISQDRYNQLIALAADKYNTTSGASKAFQTALSGINGQVVALSAGAGPVGTILAAFGPAGIAAAAGIGLVTTAYHAMVDSSLEAGRAARETQTFLLTTGLTTDQFSALKRASVDLGISTDDLTARLDRFSLQIHSVNDATGPLYDAIRKVNPVIADQMVAARDTGTEINLLAKAYQQASQFQKALIAESAFGRGGVAFGPTLNAVADAGGLQAMQKALDDINTGTEAQIALRAKLTTQFEENNKAAEKLITSIYSDNILSIADSLSEKTLAWAKALKSAADEAQRIAGSPIDYLISKAAPNFGTGAPSQPSATMPVPPLSLSSAEGFGKGAGDSPTAIANKYQALLGALGQAATPAQQLQGRFNELNKAIELNIIDAGQAARVQGILKESFAVDQLRAMVSALGAAATPAEQYRVTVASLHLELDKGQISQSTYNRAVANAAITYDQAINAGRERLGLLTTEEIGLANLQAIQDGVSKGFIRSSTDMTTAQLVLAKSLKDTNDRMEVLRSPLPGLTQATLDAGNFAKQLDTLTTTSLTNLGNGLTDILTQTVDLQTGIKNLEQQLIKSLVNMVVQMTIVQPIAATLRATLSPLAAFGIGGGSNPIVPGATNVVGANGDLPVPTFQAHSGGLIDSISPTRYVHPSYFDDAPRYHSGGVAGLAPDEVPAILQRGERVVPAGAGSGTLKQEITFNVSGAMGRTEILQAISQGMAAARQQAVSIVNANAPARQDRYNKLGT